MIEAALAHLPNPVLLALAVPLLQLLAAGVSMAQTGGRGGGWAAATGLAALGATAALAAAGLALLQGPASLRLGPELALGELGALAFSLRLDGVSAAMLVLVSFVGAVITAYSRRYLDGEPGHDRFLRWLMLTLTAVSVLVLSNNLLLLALAWVATSLCLHPLLTFYQGRPRALAAAHRKFLVSRLGDACLLAAVALVGSSMGSFELDQVLAAVAAAPTLAPDLQAAAVLFALSAILKCAQLPFHGWLVQVMEAPTPVSALLHAGIVNIGGYLLIRLSPLMVEAAAAQALLLAVGGATAALAALIMTRQTSVKVRLAWSTCAQMGFMLAQCGLGAYSLALLHLLAHSLYKAHAFLSAGETVERQAALRALGPMARPSLVAWALAPVLAAALVLPASLALGVDPGAPQLALTALLALAGAPLLARVAAGTLALAPALGGLGLLAGLYLGAHGAVQGLTAGIIPTAAPAPAVAAVVVAGLIAAYSVQGALALRPEGALARTLAPHLRAGLYLDELFTRTAFRLWPARPARSHAPLPERTFAPHASKEHP